MFNSHVRLKFGDALILVYATDTLMNAVLLCHFALLSLQDKVLYIFTHLRIKYKAG